jgi:hypothetical protein
MDYFMSAVIIVAFGLIVWAFRKSNKKGCGCDCGTNCTKGSNKA